MAADEQTPSPTPTNPVPTTMATSATSDTTAGNTNASNSNNTLSQAKYADLTFNSPLSAPHADALIAHLALSPSPSAGTTTPTSVVDLGCGWGELLLRAAESVAAASSTSSSSSHSGEAPGAAVTFTGVDTDAALLDRGRLLAAQRLGSNSGGDSSNASASPSVTFVDAPASSWTQPAHRAICIGSSHALGGTRPALQHLTRIVGPYSSSLSSSVTSAPPSSSSPSPSTSSYARVLFGEMFWQVSPPPEATRALFGDDEVPGSLADLVASCRDEGWTVLHVSVADQAEWDDFESRHRSGQRRWLLEHPGSEGADELRRQLDQREHDYLAHYRGILGFAFLILAR
ncbi:SAM-dependent methyltransferase [Purpureocillium lilacinum]|uniref:SAM-dependent methyltransferase n=1 Tax=Purpureocillium lilacinum TaxID=33203 RepID=A0A2U3E7A8_PURLI|nr:SAM-dependent methyltransferase [Purpureocillium lilacinum]